MPRSVVALIVAGALVAGALAACGTGGDGRADLTASLATSGTTGSPRASSTSVPAPATTAAGTTTTHAVPSRAPTTTSPPDLIQRAEIGRSVEGRPIVAVERGTPGGTVVLVVGVIHGDEPAGAAVVQQLVTTPVPAGIDLWLVESANPDGQARGTRTNARQVDLNRNYPSRWAPLGQPGDPEYAGNGPASEPETLAMVALINLIRPDLAVWYHQDLFRVAPAAGRAGRVRQRYAELTGLPVLPVTGGTYTGTAASWEQHIVPDGVAFIVELGPSLSAEEAAIHARAVLEVASS